MELKDHCIQRSNILKGIVDDAGAESSEVVIGVTEVSMRLWITQVSASAHG